REVFGGAFPDLNQFKSYGLTGTVAYELTDDITIKSLTGYRDIRQVQNQDFDRTPLPIYALNERIDIEYFTQELQLVGNSFDDRLKWVVGGFYYWDHADDFRRRLGGSATSDSAFTDDLTALNPATTGLGKGELEIKKITTKSIAFFGQGTFQMTDQLSLTAGLRYTKDKKEFLGFRENRGRVCVDNTTGVVTSVGAACPVGTTRTSVTHTTNDSWTNWSPRLTVDYRWTPDVMTYISASRGFKGGGFNDTVPTTCANGDTKVCGLTNYKPETLWSYEAGLRSDLFDRHLRFNLTGFYIKYSDLQIEYIEGSPPTRFTTNGDSTVKGFEAELMAAPTDGLLLRASVGYTNSKYDKDVLDPTGTTVKIQKTVPYFRSPKWSYTLGANYTIPVMANDELSFDINWGWKDTQASTAIPTNSIIMPSYGLLNGRIQYKAKAGWSLAVFGNNLTNAYYYTSAFDPGGPTSQASPGTNVAHDAVFGFAMLDIGRPREFGVELSYKF
ncbi:MAG: TonB-dependent receptor, partial [Sphingomonadaceae bacterium]|nr:TonB-dependent receptor [Sphingomonadaceae bacterium]